MLIRKTFVALSTHAAVYSSISHLLTTNNQAMMDIVKRYQSVVTMISIDPRFSNDIVVSGQHFRDCNNVLINLDDDDEIGNVTTVSLEVSSYQNQVSQLSNSLHSYRKYPQERPRQG